MSDYFILLEIARTRQPEMFRKAETEQCYGQLKANRPGLFWQIGNRLVDTGQWLTAHSQSNPATPMFSEK